MSGRARLARTGGGYTAYEVFALGVVYVTADLDYSVPERRDG
jgi:hypothetical protein